MRTTQSPFFSDFAVRTLYLLFVICTSFHVRLPSFPHTVCDAGTIAFHSLKRYICMRFVTGSALDPVGMDYKGVCNCFWLIVGRLGPILAPMWPVLDHFQLSASGHQPGPTGSFRPKLCRSDGLTYGHLSPKFGPCPDSTNQDIIRGPSGCRCLVFPAVAAWYC